MGGVAIRLKNVGGQKLVCIGDICYIEVRRHNLFYHICGRGERTESVIETRGAMQDAEKQLAQYDFVRCGISYLVNLKNVTSIMGNNVYLGQIRLPISRNYKKAFTEAFMRFLSKRNVVMDVSSSPR